MADYRYERDSDVHVADCSGTVTLAVGVERVRALKRALSQRPPRSGIFRLLLDFRETTWADASVHGELSRITREELGLGPDNASMRLALVNERWAGPVAENEHWFVSVEDAMRWLCR